jgi:methionyl-tRNA formyltransferase
MTKISETIVFFGNERLATGVKTNTPTLQALVEAGYNVAVVVSNYETGQSRNARTLEIHEVAERYGIPVMLPAKLTDITEHLRSFNATVGVLVAYGKIVPQTIIDIFPRGIVNIHPSLLPMHRGPTPIESVILNGDQKTGVSIMKLVKEMDAGPVYVAKEVPLKGNESKQELSERLLGLGKDMLVSSLPDIIKGNLTPKPQDDTRATYDTLLSKEDGVIDWSKSAAQLAREVRAFAEWPKSRTELGGKETIITEAHVGGFSKVAPQAKPFITPDGLIGVLTGEGLLVIDRLKPAGKREMSSKEFIAGYGRLL